MFLKIGSKDALSLDVRADGPSEVLSIIDYKEEQSLYKFTARDADFLQLRRHDNIASSTSEFEAIENYDSPTLSILVQLAGCGISIMNRKLIEICYLTIGDFKFEYSYNTLSQSYNLSFGTFQVDDQLHDAQFPVLLQPSPFTNSTRGAYLPPILQASFVILNDSGISEVHLSLLHG